MAITRGCARPGHDGTHLPVEGMTCASCVSTGSNALNTVADVSAVSVNLATGVATVSFGGSETDEATLRITVEAAGYQVPAGDHPWQAVGITQSLRVALPVTAAATAASSLFVVGNSLWLRSFSGRRAG